MGWRQREQNYYQLFSCAPSWIDGPFPVVCARGRSGGNRQQQRRGRGCRNGRSGRRCRGRHRGGRRCGGSRCGNGRCGCGRCGGRHRRGSRHRRRDDSVGSRPCRCGSGGSSDGKRRRGRGRSIHPGNDEPSLRGVFYCVPPAASPRAPRRERLAVYSIPSPPVILMPPFSAWPHRLRHCGQKKGGS